MGRWENHQKNFRNALTIKTLSLRGAGVKAPHFRKHQQRFLDLFAQCTKMRLFWKKAAQTDKIFLVQYKISTPFALLRRSAYASSKENVHWKSYQIVPQMPKLVSSSLCRSLKRWLPDLWKSKLKTWESFWTIECKRYVVSLTYTSSPSASSHTWSDWNGYVCTEEKCRQNVEWSVPTISYNNSTVCKFDSVTCQQSHLLQGYKKVQPDSEIFLVWEHCCFDKVAKDIDVRMTFTS